MGAPIRAKRAPWTVNMDKEGSTSACYSFSSMDHDFWRSRWKSGDIGFHRDAPNSLLVEQANYLRGASRIYAPLCGKSLDLTFLRGKGHHVFGTELAHEAIEQLFDALKETPVRSTRGPYQVYEVERLTILEGDAFALEAEHLGGKVDAIYDRGSFVAVDPKTQRGSLLDSFARVLAPKGKIALVVFEYDQAKADGPPWSVSEKDVAELFASFGVPTRLGERPESVSPRLAQAGIETITERLYGITR